MAPAMPCKIVKKSKHRETRGKTNEFKSKIACILKANELQDCVWKNLYRITMKTLLQEKRTTHYIITSCVNRIPPTTENWLRKLYTYNKKNYNSTEDKHETNHINIKYNDTNTRKMHNT